ncbi:MAG: bifunctional phosphoribosylaminoimidazolecarboxamide formyltransferase/IMP cyclohydrolase, partial [Actinobacteria bacterium]|nr:bifunctional phosphoribosylaminoimidazolecarboxamide formyltransferase/IMP cyclohydrolase [Actinomycetota bacterium]
MTKVPIKRALISVYDKTGLTDLARALAAGGAEIVSTGSTAAAISAAGVPVTRVEDVTGFPECLDGRVKTLHPGIHAGLLADLRLPEHAGQLATLGIEPFQLLVSSLYPFEATVASGAPPEECVEQIDIGGPAMLRAAAKNHATVAVVTDPGCYGEVIDAVRAGGFTLAQRQRLAAQAYARTAAYDAAVASWFASAYAPDAVAGETGWPDVIAAVWSRGEVLRYGENPHQRAARYLPAGGSPAATGLTAASQLHGKAMSYNNYVDAAAALRAAYDFTEPAVAIIKHSTPCGIAVAAGIAEAHRKAHASDPQSAFGGVIAANREITEDMARQVADVFTEVIVAPAFSAGALGILTAQKSLRLLTCPAPATAAGTGSGGAPPEWRQIDGGLLAQSPDLIDAPGDDPARWELKTGA